MLESTITIKGQTTVPQAIRIAMHAGAGTRLNWLVMPDGTVIVRPQATERERGGHRAHKPKAVLGVDDDMHAHTHYL